MSIFLETRVWMLRTGSPRGSTVEADRAFYSRGAEERAFVHRAGTRARVRYTVLLSAGGRQGIRAAGGLVLSRCPAFCQLPAGPGVGGWLTYGEVGGGRPDAAGSKRNPAGTGLANIPQRELTPCAEQQARRPELGPDGHHSRRVRVTRGWSWPGMMLGFAVPCSVRCRIGPEVAPLRTETQNAGPFA